MAFALDGWYLWLSHRTWLISWRHFFLICSFSVMYPRANESVEVVVSWPANMKTSVSSINPSRSISFFISIANMRVSGEDLGLLIWRWRMKWVFFSEKLFQDLVLKMPIFFWSCPPHTGRWFHLLRPLVGYFRYILVLFSLDILWK